MTLTVAVDGSALGNPGPAGWAWAISTDQWDSGGWDHGTNNLGELTAIQQILIATEAAGLRDQPLHLQADSQYAINVITKWMHGWKKRGWTKGDKKPIANLELIQDIDRLMAGRSVTFEWVRGHAGHPLNELADDLAREAAALHQAGKVAPGGPGIDDSCSDSPVSATASVEGLLARSSLRSAPLVEARPGPADLPPPANETCHASLTGGVAAAPPDSLAPDGRSVHTPEAYPATTTPPVSSSEGTSVTSAQIEHAQQALIEAWFNGRTTIADSYLGDGFVRVWPNGTQTASFMGSCPPQPSIGTITVTPVGSAFIATYQLLWANGASYECSIWSVADGTLTIIHHQSTLIPRHTTATP